MLSATDKIKIALIHEDKKLKDLAEAAGMSKQNLHSRLAKNNLNEADLKLLTEALGIRYEITLILPDGTEI